MGSGCLKPPAPTSQLNVSVLDQIFEQAKHSSPPSSSSQQKCLAYYLEMKEIITKKGQLRKLCDYLTSHRDFICESIMHSYRIIGQSKSASAKYVGLIVLDSILGVGPKRKAISNKKQSTNQIKQFTIQQCFGDSLKQSGNKLFLVSEKQTKIEGIKKLIRQPLNNINTSSMFSKNQEIRAFADQLISARFQSIYFNMINLIIQQDGQLYKLGLENIIKYCTVTSAVFPNQMSHSQIQSQFSRINDTVDKFTADSQVIQIMKNINYHLIVGNQMRVSLKAYWAMLRRLKQTFFTTNLDCLESFFDIFIAQVSQSNHRTQKIDENQDHPGNSQMLIEPQIPRLCSAIISLFFKTCIESYQHNAIIEEIFKALDKNKFKGVNPIQNILFDSVDQSELKIQFSRALLMHLLAYVSWPQNNHAQNQSPFLKQQSKLSQNGESDEANYSPLQKSWLECFKLPPSFSSVYKNILDSQCKLNNLPRVQKWLYQFKVVNPAELLAYSGQNLINCFLLNFYSNQQQIQAKSISELRSIFLKFSQNSLTINFAACLIRTVQENTIIDDQGRWFLMTVWEDALVKQKNLSLTEPHGVLIPTMAPSYCYENNTKALQIMLLVVSKMKIQFVRTKIQEICNFFDSFYVELISGFSSALQKIQLVEELEKGLKPIEPILRGVIVAFSQKINNILGSQNSKNEEQEKEKGHKISFCPENHLLFVDFLGLCLCHTLGMDINRKNIGNYCQHIKLSPLNQHLKILRQYESQRTPLNIEFPKNLAPIERFKLENYEESLQIFRFKKMKESHQSDAHGLASVMWRGNQSMESFYSRQSGKEADKDLEDILEIIRC